MKVVNCAHNKSHIFANVFCSLGLQEVNRNLAADTKVTVVLELLDVLDDLERGARLEPDTGSTGSSTLGTLAQKFTSRQASKDFQSFRSPSVSSLIGMTSLYCKSCQGPSRVIPCFLTL